MECPICNGKAHVELDLHSDGFAQDALECGDCGAIWSQTESSVNILKGPNPPAEQSYADFFCPTCHAAASLEVDLDSDQFHEEIYECTTCGTICSLAHDQLEVVKDSQAGSFLSSTSDSVEASDYAFI